MTSFVEVFVGQSSKSLFRHCWRVSINWFMDLFFLFKPVWKRLLWDVILFNYQNTWAAFINFFKNLILFSYWFWNQFSFMGNLQLPTNVLRSIYTHSKKALQFIRKCVCNFFNAMSLNSNLFYVSYLGSHCIEVPLKRNFSLMGPKRLLPLSESPTYLVSQLSEVFLVQFSTEVQGTEKFGPS